MPAGIVLLVLLCIFCCLFYLAVTSKDTSKFISTTGLLNACNGLSVTEESRTAVCGKMIKVVDGEVTTENTAYFDGIYFVLTPGKNGKVEGIFHPSKLLKLFDGASKFQREIRIKDRISFTAIIITMDMKIEHDQHELEVICTAVGKIDIHSA